MADQSQIRQLQTPDNQINVFPITLEDCISDSNGMVLSQKMATLQSDIATVEPSSTSAHAYAVGDYLMYSSQLYRVTQAISVGDTLVVGTNIEVTTIAENLGSGGTGTVTQVSTGAGLTGGPITSSGTVKAKLKDETQSSLTAASKGSTADREYAVGLDANGNLSVNVPWESGSTGAVTGVKGNAESSYRTGDVNITPANLGALATNGNSQNCTASFTSSDNASTTDKTSAGFTSVDTLASGEKHSSIFQKISKMFLNIRKLWNTVGTELGPVSKIVGDTSVTFTNSAIKTTSELELLCENSTNEVIRYTGVTVSAGSATYTFPALTVGTNFYLKVR